MSSANLPDHALLTFGPLDDGTRTSIRAKVFGHLVKLASPTLEIHQGDLYHDAHWLDEHVTGTVTMGFYFAFNESGTDITESVGDVYRTENVYHVRLIIDESEWSVAARISIVDVTPVYGRGIQ
jgi:hypothetical protein